MTTGFGAKNWDVPGIRYDQENNIIEQIFLDLLKAGDKQSSYLESCNVEMVGTAVEAVGGKWLQDPPPIAGIHFMSHTDYVFFFLNSKNVKPRLPKVSDIILENEFMENLEYVIPLVSTARAKIRKGRNIVDLMISSLKMKYALGLSYLTDYGTGHYITVVYYDLLSREFVCYDSWSRNKHCEAGGVMERYPAEFFRDRMKGYRSRFLEVYV